MLAIVRKVKHSLGPRPQGFSFRKCECPGEEVEDKHRRMRSWAKSCQELPGHCMGFSPVFTVTTSHRTRDPVACNNEACLMRRASRSSHSWKNCLAFLDGRHPSSLFCQLLTSPGNKTFAVSIWFTAILWDLCT